MRLPKTYKPWTLNEALELIRELQPEVMKMNHYITLGGGVLNVGESNKDLDLYILPFDDCENADSVKVREFIIGKFTWISTLFNPYYSYTSPFIYKDEYQCNNKRIDIWIGIRWYNERFL